ncbi:MAG: glycosyltransferase [Rhodothermales bacterium]|nr:glycosyltransferase [Rhodothermales bacterium]
MTVLLIAIHALLWTILLGNVIYLRRSSPRVGHSADEPVISILIPARNEAENLATLIPSILNQSYPSFELILYDDDSTDETPAVVATELHDDRVTYLRGHGPPEGWVGKVAALYEASRHASGEIYLFMDADTRLLKTDSLARIVALFARAPGDSVLTGLLGLVGRGRILVSLVPFTILAALPWFLVRRLRSPLLSALNGQLWMIRATTYHALEPHKKVKSEVLEDVEIGRYLKASGVYPTLVDLTQFVSVRMYSSFADAWRGFRKNAYLIMGGRRLPFAIYLVLFAASTWMSPLVSIYFLISACAIKLVADRLADIPIALSLASPVSFILATFLQLDSAIAHWTGRVRWKGRNVASD